MEPEILSWTLTVAAPIAPAPEASAEATPAGKATPIDSRVVFDPDLQRDTDYAIHARADLAPGMTVAGPALIVEDQTTTVVTSTFNARVGRPAVT
ncbi:MAG: hypothetical protein ACMVO3_00115 [Thalassobaculum sp.]